MAAIPTTIKIASPGRINLIGEHIDYNDGVVLPAAIEKCIYFTLSPNGHRSSFSITSEDFGDTFQGDLKNTKSGSQGWHKYIIGVLAEIQKRSNGLRGFNCTLHSEIPVGSGLSSSAALECGLAFGLNKLFDLRLDSWDLIRIGQDAEHHYVGTQCGIMDQFASVMGKPGNCMLLDCRSLDFKYVPAEFGPFKLLLLNTNISHNLASGGYNERRKESAAALEVLARNLDIKPTYRDVTPEHLREGKQFLSEVEYKRASFIVAEIQRVREAVKALGNRDLYAFGQYLFLSHEGLSEAYEVSCPELDFLVELARENEQIAGARMIGGGFGGCTLNLIHQEAITDFIAVASKAYNSRFRQDLSWFEVKTGPGTRLL